MNISEGQYFNLTPPDRAERVAYFMWRIMEFGKSEAEKGISDETITNIIQRNWFKLYNRWRHEDDKVRRFADLTDAMVALETLKELHKANRLDLISDVAQYRGEYAKACDAEYGIIRPDSFGYGGNIPSKVKIV